MSDLGQQLLGTTFQNPIILASGTCGYGQELDGLLDIDTVGALAIKAVTLEPRAGNPAPRVAEFGAGTFPDGFEFDAEGGIWIASVVSNRLLRISPDGTETVVLEDSDPEVVAAVERKYQESGLARADIDAGRERTLANLASVAFGGPDLKTVHLGSLFGDRIATFRSAIAGAEPAHWRY